MNNKPFKVLQISGWDNRTGADRIAWNLFQAARKDGNDSWMAVGEKRGDDSDVFQIQNDELRGAFFRFWSWLHKALRPLDGHWCVWRLYRLMDQLAHPGRTFDELRGYEDFNYPGAWKLLDMLPEKPDVIHCHNLHHDYFDLNALPALNKDIPMIVTLHDAWMLSGHCAHSLDCDRWQTGCGSCPDLNIYKKVKRDATAYNWQKKREIYSKCRLNIGVPSQWLKDKVEASMLADTARDIRVIPHGVDLSIFRSGDKAKARSQCGVPQDAKVVLFANTLIKNNPFKDYATMRKAISKTSSIKNLLFIALGEEGQDENIGNATIRFIPYKKDSKDVALFYQAADVYLHGARADTYPNTVIESLACGTPVVASAVGGIPEQINSLDTTLTNGDTRSYTTDDANGILVPPEDDDAMAKALEHLLDNEQLLHGLGKNGVTQAQLRFDLKVQLSSYLKWYSELLDDDSINTFQQLESYANNL